MIKKIALSIGLILALQGCFPDVIRPKFKNGYEHVINELKTLKSFEDANVKSSARSKLGIKKTTNILIVQLVNGKDMPEDEFALRMLGRHAMKIAVSSIENEHEYDTFQTMFDKKASEGPVNAHTSRSFVYSIYELATTKE
jgi:hypothetical protein